MMPNRRYILPLIVLSLIFPSETIGQDLEVVAISNDSSLIVGDTALLICVGYGQPDVQITWSRNSENIMNASLISIYEEEVTQGGRLFKQSFLELCSLQSSDAGDYICTVSNDQATANATTQLFVSEAAKLELVVISNDTSLTVGDTALLICVGYGQPDVRITWSRNDENMIMNASLISIYEEEVTQGGRLFKQSFLELCSLQSFDAGNYTCTVSNDQATANATTQLFVSEAAKLELVVISNDTSLTVGDTALLICVGYGQPDVQITWSRNGENIMNTSLISIYEEEVTQGGRLFKQSFLELCSLQSSDAGNYTCTVSNGQATANATTQLFVSVPAVLLQGPYNRSSPVGSSVNFSCEATSEPQHTITWIFNNTVISSGGRYDIKNTPTISTLIITDIQEVDAGTYSCTVSNIHGNGTASAELVVQTVTLTISQIERLMPSALGNTSAMDSLLDLIDKLLEMSFDELQASQEEFNSSSRLLDLLEQLVEAYPIPQSPQLIRRDMYGCIVYSITTPEDITFSPSLTDSMITLTVGSDPDLSFTIPSSLINNFSLSSPPSLIFCVFRGENLFIRRNSYLLENNHRSFLVGGSIVSAKFSGGLSIRNLQDPVSMTFTKKPSLLNGSRTECSYWDQSLDDGYGAWSGEGCRLVEETGDQSTCNCDHLTSFTILVDTSPRMIKHSGTYIIAGAIFVILCAVFVIISVAVTSEVRGIAIGVFLINFCLALVFLNISFIVSAFVGGSQSACKAFAFIFHYFLLVSSFALPTMIFFQAFTSFGDLKKKIAYITGVLTNWVFPVLVVALCFGLDGNSYHNSDPTAFCRSVSNPYWFGMLLVGGLLLLLTLVLLVLFPILIKKEIMQKPNTICSGWQYDYFGHIAITIFFFVTWAFGLFATGVLNTNRLQLFTQISFIITSFLLGVFLVLCYCLFPGHVRTAICCCRRKINDTECHHNIDENVKDNEHTYDIPLKEVTPPPDYENIAALDLHTKEDFSTKEDLGNEAASLGAQGGTRL